MREKVAKLIKKACLSESKNFKKQFKRTWNKTPRSLRSKFKEELLESISAKENKSAE